MASHDSTRRRTTTPTSGRDDGGSALPTRDIPDKLYFRIGEVAKLCELPTHVLRFWETEFPQLRPNKGGTGQRLYRRRDVEMAFRIKALLYDRGYTIPGARQAFRHEVRAGKDPQLSLGIGAPALADQKQMRSIQKELLELKAMLSAPAFRRPVVKAGVQSIRKPKHNLAMADAPASGSISVMEMKTGETLFD